MFGYGVYTFGPGEWFGEKYEGFYVNDKKHGEGTYTFADGTVRRGVWSEGKIIK